MIKLKNNQQYNKPEIAYTKLPEIKQNKNHLQKLLIIRTNKHRQIESMNVIKCSIKDNKLKRNKMMK